MMKMTNVSVLPINGSDGALAGVFSESKCMEKILEGSITVSSTVSECMDQTVKQVTPG